MKKSAEEQAIDQVLAASDSTDNTNVIAEALRQAGFEESEPGSGDPGRFWDLVSIIDGLVQSGRIKDLSNALHNVEFGLKNPPKDSPGHELFETPGKLPEASAKQAQPSKEPSQAADDKQIIDAIDHSAGAGVNEFLEREARSNGLLGLEVVSVETIGPGQQKIKVAAPLGERWFQLTIEPWDGVT